MKQARVLTHAEIKRVLVYCSGTKHAQRNRLAVLLSHYAGLRVGEIASLSWDQLVDTNGDTLALDALTTPRISRDTIREANGYLRFALRKITIAQQGAA